MSSYVMSDIHGHFEEFQQMLKKIEFDDNDELIIAGDYVDRGTQTCEMMRWIDKCPENVLLLRGNHDVEYAECVNILDIYCRKLELDECSIDDTKTLYQAVNSIPAINSAHFDYYGTICKLVMNHGVTLSELKRWAEIIREMPYVYKRSVNGKRYIIVHAGYYEDKSIPVNELEQFYIYAREDAYRVGGVSGATIIAGHTPTVMKGLPMYTGGEVFKMYDRRKNCTFYNIDCGCGYMDSEKYQNCKLACIRLEDEQIFYVS